MGFLNRNAAEIGYRFERNRDFLFLKPKKYLKCPDLMMVIILLNNNYFWVN